MSQYIEVTEVVDSLLCAVEALSVVADSLDDEIHDGAVYLLRTMADRLTDDWENLDTFLQDERLQAPFRRDVQIKSETPCPPKGQWVLNDRGPEYRAPVCADA